jgi:hypothetical protein
MPGRQIAGDPAPLVAAAHAKFGGQCCNPSQLGTQMSGAEPTS